MVEITIPTIASNTIRYFIGLILGRWSQAVPTLSRTRAPIHTQSKGGVSYRYRPLRDMPLWRALWAAREIQMPENRLDLNSFPTIIDVPREQTASLLAKVLGITSLGFLITAFGVATAPAWGTLPGFIAVLAL